MMKAHTEENGCKPSVARNYKVRVLPVAIATFRKSWPCSGLPSDDTLHIEFDREGGLVGLAWESGQDHWEAETSGALLALVNECGPNKSI